VLKEDKPRFMGVHLIALDGTEHREGPNTPEAFRVLEALDGMVGELVSAALANDPETVLAIVSDHGFIATHTMVNLRTAFVSEGLIELALPSPEGAPVKVKSWQAQVWPGGATAAVVLRDRADQATRTRVAGVLKKLAADPRNGVAVVLDAKAVTAKGAFPGADFVVEFQPGFYLGNALTGALLTPGTSRGTHGYLPDRPEMHATFLIRGRGIAAGRKLDVIDMRAIAPTLARVLGVSLPSAREPALQIFEKEAK
jgi:predicted AlkP superfamily pyrophosphatase or phosphodiesterase